MKTYLMTGVLALALLVSFVPMPVAAQPPPNCPPFCCNVAQHAAEVKLVKEKLVSLGIQAPAPEMVEAIIVGWVHPANVAAKTAGGSGAPKSVPLAPVTRTASLN